MVFLNGVVPTKLLLLSKAPRAVYQVYVNIVFSTKTISNELYLMLFLTKNYAFLGISRSE
jgi:hypothetical protein